MNCFRKIGADPCPCCGYTQERDGQALTGSILIGRYLVGRPLNRTGLEYTYKGLDLARRRGVTIREYFPAGFTLRGQDGAVLWQDTPEADALRDAGVDSFLQGAVETDPELTVVDSFLSGGTAYIIRRKKPEPPKPEVPENPWVPFLIAAAAVLAAIVTGLSLLRSLPARQPEETVPPETYSQVYDDAGVLRTETYRDAQGQIVSVLVYDSNARLLRRESYTSGTLTTWAELIYDSNGTYQETVIHQAGSGSNES